MVDNVFIAIFDMYIELQFNGLTNLLGILINVYSKCSIKYFIIVACIYFPVYKYI